MSGVPASIARLDATGDAFVEQIRHPLLDHVAYGLSAACDHSMLWHAVGAVIAARRATVRPAVRLSIALGVESAVTNLFVKSLFRRARPESQSQSPSPEPATTTPFPYGMRVPITSSFPSGHAASAFLAAAILHEETGSWAWYGLAAAVGASRVYVRMHHTSDVVAGAALGYALARVVRVAWRR